MVFSAVFTPALNLAISSTTYCCRRRRTSSTTRRVVTVKANSTKKDESKDKDAPAFNPFGFVTDNPSSRSAIQLPENPAEDGNVGQMLYVLIFISFPPSSFECIFGLKLEML
ncbi:hypothetical protein HKD37_08G022462 [Glycine soja]